MVTELNWASMVFSWMQNSSSSELWGFLGVTSLGEKFLGRLLSASDSSKTSKLIFGRVNKHDFCLASCKVGDSTGVYKLSIFMAALDALPPQDA